MSFATCERARATGRGRLRQPCANARALRVVAVVAMDCRSAGECLGVAPLAAPLWPSTLYAWLAETAATSPTVWDRCARRLDDSLGRWLAPYVGASPEVIARALCERGGTTMSGQEIAAALWALVRRRDRAMDAIIDRLAREAEVSIARTSLRS